MHLTGWVAAGMVATSREGSFINFSSGGNVRLEFFKAGLFQSIEFLGLWVFGNLTKLQWKARVPILR
jgi:hypothetical protein